MINCEYLNHCGYVVETNLSIYIFDYVAGQLPAHYLTSHKPVYFIVTSGDADRFSDAIFKFRKPIIVANDVLISPFKDVFKVGPGDCIHLGHAKVHCMATNRTGVAVLICEAACTILNTSRLNIWQWEGLSTTQQVQKAKQSFEVACTAMGDLGLVDVLIATVDPRLGGAFDQGISRLVAQFKPRHLFPMQFGEDGSRLETLAQKIHKGSDTQVHIPSYPNYRFKDLSLQD